MIIEYSTVWDDEDKVFLHWGTGEINGFLYRYAVESHDEMISVWDREQIRQAFKQQLIEVASYHEAPGRLQ